MSQLPIRIIFGKEIIRLAEEYGYYAVCADTKCCSFEDFGDIYPERQISIGIAEQNLIGVASGLASCGHKVVLATYSVFATMRACEQLRTYICHPKQDVIVMGRRGKDVTLIATGIMLDRTVKAAKALEARGVNAQIMEIHTLKPIDREAVITAAGETGAIVTVEDHSVIGGLGGAVAEVLATNLPVSMRMIGIQDCFARSGDAEALYEANHMTAADIVAAAEELVERKKIR